MNKIKLMYDVVTTMRDKEAVKGLLEVEAKRDQVKIFGMNNEFENNFSEGRIKANLSTELDCDGKKMKHESTIDFNMQDCQGHRRHCFMQHMHHAHEHGNEHLKFRGPKHGLNKLAFVLGVFNSIKAEEKEDKSYVLSLSLKDVPEDIKNSIHERMNQHNLQDGHGPHKFMKEFHCINDPEVNLNIMINQNYEVEKILVDVKGIKTDESGINQEMKLNAALSFNW